ncbi:MAG: hypothetical protein J6V91_03965 [Kiritimatiellae bacterium]|nr:hypothetical protein [Kiritimatiellia bacterium]
METKNTNTPVVVIALAVVVIVAMICGMVVWLMQRSMAMNERLNDRLLEVRLQEAKARTAQVQPDAPTATTPTPNDSALTEMQARLKAAEEAVKRETEARRKAEREAAALRNRKPTTPAKKPTEKVEPSTAKVERPAAQKPAPKPTATKAPQPQAAPKRKAPTETKAAASRIGADGYPINRVTLPIGNDELDWQL